MGNLENFANNICSYVYNNEHSSANTNLCNKQMPLYIKNCITDSSQENDSLIENINNNCSGIYNNIINRNKRNNNLGSNIIIDNTNNKTNKKLYKKLLNKGNPILTVSDNFMSTSEDIERIYYITKINKILSNYRGYIARKKIKKIIKHHINFQNKLKETILIYIHNKKNNFKLRVSKEKFKDLLKTYKSRWKDYYKTDPEYEMNVYLEDKIRLNSIKITYTNNGYKNLNSSSDLSYKDIMLKLLESKIIDNNTIKEHILSMSYSSEEDKEDLDNIINILSNINSIYIGEVNIDNQKNGAGVLYKVNGERYEGLWCKDKFEGWNNFIDLKGNLYIGKYVYNNLTGKGEKYLLNGNIYKGDFTKGKENGMGKENNEDYIYIGQFYNGVKQGKGKFIYKLNGNVYYGDVKNNLPDGYGHLKYGIKQKEYVGMFKKGLFEGKGTCIYENFGTFRGNFEKGIKEGPGEFLEKDGIYYEGLFKNDLPNGIGYLDNGKGFKGKVQFIDGKINKNYKSLNF